jgi:hypothetical protein
MSNGEVKVTGILNQLAPSVIVLFLSSAVFRHAENDPALIGAGKVKSISDCWQRRVLAR